MSVVTLFIKLRNESDLIHSKSGHCEQYTQYVVVE